MKMRHSATVTIPYQPTVADLKDAMASLADLPLDAKVDVTKTKREFDQRENSSWGGETTFKVFWES